MKRSRLRPVSRGRARQQRKRRALAPVEGEACWLAIPGVCTGLAEAWHELVGAGQGGSRVDPRNLCLACLRCNSFCEDEPLLAKQHGWKVHPGHAVRGEGGLVPGYAHPLAAASRGWAA